MVVSGKLRVSIDYQKLNVVTTVDIFPLLFTESMLNVILGHKMYTLIDMYSRYDQILIALVDQVKISFIT